MDGKVSNIDFLILKQRPVNNDDTGFLKDLYCQSRDYETTVANIPAETLKQFLHQQFLLQTEHFNRVYKNAECNLIQYQGAAIGRIYFNQENENLHLIDITLLRNYRGLGIGRFFITNLLSKTKVRTTLYVNERNPALFFYKKLGFKELEKEQGYIYMERNLHSNANRGG